MISWDDHRRHARIIHQTGEDQEPGEDATHRIVHEVPVDKDLAVGVGQGLRQDLEGIIDRRLVVIAVNRRQLDLDTGLFVAANVLVAGEQ